MKKIIKKYTKKDFNKVKSIVNNDYADRGVIVDFNDVKRFMNQYNISNIDSLTVHRPYVFEKHELLCIAPARIEALVKIARHYQKRSIYGDIKLPKVSDIKILGIFNNDNGTELVLTSDKDAKFFTSLPDDAIIDWEYTGSYYYQVIKANIDHVTVRTKCGMTKNN